jgi:hypothetical protein
MGGILYFLFDAQFWVFVLGLALGLVGSALVYRRSATETWALMANRTLRLIGVVTAIFATAAILVTESMLLRHPARDATAISDAKSPARPHSEEAFSELLTQDSEVPNFGLYSYLLLGNTPQNDDERARDLSAVMAVSSFSRASDMRRRFNSESLNITYLPLRIGVPIRINPTDSDTGKALLKQYDFARARAYLNIIDPTLRSGPYIVSVLQPLAASNGHPAEFLFQDMSTATPRVVTRWVCLFQIESAKEKFWEPEDGQRFALAFRSDLDIVAHDIVSNMPSKLADLIGWHSDTGGAK